MVIKPAEFIDVGNPPEVGAANEALDPKAAATTPSGRTPVRKPNADLPYTFAKRHGVLLETADDGSMKLVHRPGVTVSALTETRRKAGQALTPEAISADEFDARLTQHYEGETGQAVDIMDDFGDGLDLAELADALPEPEDLLESTDDAPVIRLINAIMAEAVRKQASDIHIEPFESRLLIRYRVDGVMQKLLEPPREIAPLVISRLKVMAKLDIAERRKPLDGSMTYRVAGRPVDFRVSTLPSKYGYSFDTLNKALSLSDGIILVTGPTGSGKTTTLYAALSRLNNTRSTILTIEDPVEYHIDGIGQTQVNSKVDFNFAVGLRAILRQDPDIVMVGEIRDVETAGIAVQASLTGHLVLSTLHTNTAVGAVTRLRDMGIEPFLLGTSLSCLVAQRLVRLLCPHCKRSHTPTVPELKALAVPMSQAAGVCGPHGCEKCNHTGYIGRSGIYEVVDVDATMRTMIHDGVSEHELERYARTHGPSIHDDGIRLVLAGQTSLEEVLRVTREG